MPLSPPPASHPPGSSGALSVPDLSWFSASGGGGCSSSCERGSTSRARGVRAAVKEVKRRARARLGAAAGASGGRVKGGLKEEIRSYVVDLGGEDWKEQGAGGSGLVLPEERVVAGLKEYGEQEEGLFKGAFAVDWPADDVGQTQSFFTPRRVSVVLPPGAGALRHRSSLPSSAFGTTGRCTTPDLTLPSRSTYAPPLSLNGPLAAGADDTGRARADDDQTAHGDGGGALRLSWRVDDDDGGGPAP